MNSIGRMYTVEFESVAWAITNGDMDVFYIAPADDKPVQIHAISIDTVSEIKEAEEEWARLRIIRGHTTVGSGGTAPAATAIGKSPNDPDASFTARTNDTTIASAGTTRNLWSGGLQVRVGLREIFTPEQRYAMRCTQAETSIVVRLLAALTDDATASGTLWVEEMV